MPTMTDNDIGVTVRLTIVDDADGSAVDISAATTKQIIFVSPSGTSTTRTASFTTDGTDGQIEYVTVDGAVNAEGEWRVQGLVIFGGGTYRSQIRRISVREALD